VKPEEGASLARALGSSNLVLMNRHGATAVAGDIQALVFRAIYSCRNAEYLTQAKLIGIPSPLNPREAERAAEYNLAAGPVSRAWEYWSMRLAKAGGTPPRATKSTRSGARSGARSATARSKSPRGAKKTAKKGRR